MKVVMLAAGVGARLEQGRGAPPKSLLRFAGRSLLERHLATLAHFGLDDLTIATGYEAAQLEHEIAAIGGPVRVSTRFNEYFADSSLLSLWCVRDAFLAGEPVLYMDADVLYDWRLLGRLLGAPHADCLLIDRDVEPGEDPVKVCLRGGQVVDFHKEIRAPKYDFWGEWVGFARFGAQTAARIVPAIERYLVAGRTEVIYEEPLRDVILASPPGAACGVEDISGLPWIEIDFPDDLRRAKDEILPRLAELPNAPPQHDGHALGPAPR
jgi:choline kinase